jgi:hypothetical protein
MQVDERRACPSCSADNPHDAEFCWQCYTRFASEPSEPAQPGWGPSQTPAPSAPVTMQQSATSRGRVVQIVVGVIVAVVVAAVVRTMFASHYHVPETIAGQPRIHSAATDRFERDMVAEGDKEGLTIEAAVYGTSENPDVLLVLVDGTAAENTDELFTSFLDGVASSGVSVDENSTSTGSHGDAEWRCLPLSMGREAAVACMWREDASVGITLDLSPTTDPADALIAAYDATHA